MRQSAGLSAEVCCEPFFFGSGRAARFCVLYEPRGVAPVGTVLYVPPFAEEQNRARRSAAVGARALAQSGFCVLQMDLFGCGDSAGDFADASWLGWLDDLRGAVNLLDRRCNGPLWLWGVRAGALLASDMVGHGYARANLMLWQPVLSGAQHLKQFLRLRASREKTRQPLASTTHTPAPQGLAEQALAGETGGTTSLLDLVSSEHAARRERDAAQGMRADWLGGKSVEVAGYTISPALAFALERAVFCLPRDYRGRVVWQECARAGVTVSRASAAVIGSLRNQGVSVDVDVVADPPFWMSAEVEVCPQLADGARRLLVARP